jgi:hypothetical protein
MAAIKMFVKKVFQQSFNSHKNEQKGELSIDNHQAHLAATVIKESSYYILNMLSGQLTSIKNNLLSITSTLPQSKTRPDRQLELLFGIGDTCIVGKG